MLALKNECVIFVSYQAETLKSKQTSLNIKEISMIIGNLWFEFVLTDLVVKSATCLQTGVVYDYKKANELFRKYQIYV